jgi:site-specific DNA recombinase
MKAVIYARVSTKDQEDSGYSLESQKALLNTYAKNNGIEIAKEYVVSESASGKKIRKEFQAMLEYATKNSINAIICEKTDRLTRNPKDASTIDEWVHSKSGRAVHFVKENSVVDENTKAHQGLVWNMKVAISKFYTDNLSEEVKKGNAEKVKQGLLPGSPKIGYRSTNKDGRKVHVPDEQTAPYIQRMFDSYATGLYSLSKLTEELYMAGFRSNSGRKVSKSNIARYLSDPFYYGYFNWHGELHKGVQDTLISKETFDRVQQIKDSKLSPKYRTHKHLFKGLIRCSECNGLITWEIHRGHNYGHCNQYRPCSPKSWLKETEIDYQIARILSGLVLTNERFAAWLREALKEAGRNEHDYKKNEVTEINKNISLIDQKLTRLYEDRLDGRIETSFYDTKSSELKIEKEKLLTLLNSHSASSNKSKDLGIALFDLSQSAPTIYTSKEVEGKRNLISTVFKDLRVDNGVLLHTFNDSFQILAHAVETTNSSKVITDLTSPIRIFEPLEKGSIKTDLISLRDLCPKVLGYKDSNLDTQDQNLMSYH